MNRALAAALLSAFVFPGAGHLYLRRPRRAGLFLVPALLAAAVYVGDITTQASRMVDQILAGTLAPDPAAIAARLHAQDGGSPLLTFCGFILVAAWIGSIVDAFVVARRPTPPAR